MKVKFPQKFFRFACVGGIATAVQYCILTALVIFSHLDPVWASGIGFTASSLINYLLNYRFTFNSTKSHTKTAPIFIFLSLSGLSINTATMWALTQLENIHFLLAQIVSTGVVLIFNFWGNSKWTFYELTPKS